MAAEALVQRMCEHERSQLGLHVALVWAVALLAEGRVLEVGQVKLFDLVCDGRDV